jgi:glycosyltransferase involved in cell wall biosynthesis
MKVAFVHNLKLGGARRTMAEHMTRLDAEITEFCLATAASVREDAVVVPFAPAAPTASAALRPAMRYRDHAALLHAWRQLADLIERLAPAAIVVHPCQYLQCPPAIRWTSAPAVYFCHEVRRVDYEPAAIQSRRRRTRQVYMPLYKSERYQDRAAVMCADALVTNSTFTAAAIEQSYGRTAPAIRMGVPETFVPADVAVAPAHVLCVGTLIPGKGHDLAVEAAARSQRVWPVVIVAPRANPAEEDRLTKVAAALGVDLQIRIGVSDEALADLYRAAVCTMYLAIAEPLGLVALEAQACGCPVVVSDEGGLPETVADGESGWVVPRDPVAAAKRLDDCADGELRPGLVAAAARNGRRFSWLDSTLDLQTAIDAARRCRTPRHDVPRPTLAIVSPSQEDSGAERYIRIIAGAAVACGWHVYAALPLRESTSTVRADLEHLGATTAVLEIGSPHRPGKSAVLRRILSEMTHTLVWLNRIRSDTTLVILPHPDQTPGAVLGATLHCRRSHSSVQLVPQDWELTRTRARLYSVARVLRHRWIALSRDNRGRLASSFGWPESQIELVYNSAWSELALDGADRDSARAEIRSELDLPSDAKIVLSVGRLNRQKAHDLIVGSVPGVLAARSDVWWLWAGDGPERDRLLARIGAIGADDRVRLLGQRADVDRLLAAADVFLFPSRYEGFPLAVLEAHVARLPVIVSDSGPLPEVVRHGLDGLIVPSGEPHGLASATCWALDHPEEMAEMALSGRTRALSEFSRSSMTDATLALLEPRRRSPAGQRRPWTRRRRVYRS